MYRTKQTISSLGDRARNAAEECELRASIITELVWKDLWLDMAESWRAVGQAQDRAEELFCNMSGAHACKVHGG